MAKASTPTRVVVPLPLSVRGYRVRGYRVRGYRVRGYRVRGYRVRGYRVRVHAPPRAQRQL